MRKAALAAVLAAGVLALQAAPAHALKDIENGQQPPPLSLPDRSGRVHTLDYFDGGPGVILFWSTWSPRSAEALADFAKYHTEYASQGLKILAVNVDGENLDSQRKQTIRRYLEERDPPFPALLDEKLEAFAAYGVMAHPSTVVLNGEGRIAYTLGGYPLSLREELKNEMLKVLGLYVEPPPPDLPAVGFVPKNRALQHYNLGLNLMKKGQTDRAMTSFRRAIEKDSSFIDPAVMIARLSLSEGELDEAEALLKSADPETINRSDLRFLLGHLMLAKGRTEGAEKVFAKLAEKSPDESWGQWGLGIVALYRGDAAKALEHMIAGAALDPEVPEAWPRVKDYFVTSWSRAESLPLEEDYIALFPDLESLRNRYRKMFNLGGG